MEIAEQKGRKGGKVFSNRQHNIPLQFVARLLHHGKSGPKVTVRRDNKHRREAGMITSFIRLCQ